MSNSRRLPRLGRMLLAASCAALLSIVVVSPAGATSPDCSATPAPGVDLSGCDLSSVSLAGVDLTNADLSGARLDSATITSTTTLTGTNLSGAQLYRTDARGAIFTGANLTNAYLRKTKINAATSFVGATLTGIRGSLMDSTPTADTAPILPVGWSFKSNTLFGPTASMRNGLFLGVFSGYSFAGTTFTGSTYADMTYVTWVDSNNFSGATFGNANLTNVFLDTNNFSGVDLSGATLTGVRSLDNYGTPAALPAGWILTGGYFIGPGARFGSFQIAPPQWPSTRTYPDSDFNFSGLNLNGANLMGTTLSNVNIDGADFSGASLTGVISSGLTGTPSALPPNWSVVGGVLTYTAPAAPTPEPEPTPAPAPTPTPVVAPAEPEIYTPAPGITVGETRGEVALVPATPAASTDLLRGANIWVRPSSKTEIIPSGLPKGLKLVDGKLVAEKPGTYTVKVKVKRKNGTTVIRKVKITVS